MRLRDRVRLALIRLHDWALGKHEDTQADASQLAVERVQRKGRERENGKR